MYKNSSGIKVDETKLETTHLINSLSKKYREDIFYTSNINDFNEVLNDINTLKNEIHNRINKFYEEKIINGGNE